MKIILKSIFIVALIGLLGIVGCIGIRITEPEDVFELTYEFEYLVDIEQLLDRALNNLEPFSGGHENDFASFEEESWAWLDRVLLSSLEKESVMSEASEDMVHAQGVYTQVSCDYGVIDFLVELGSAEVKLPSHYPRDHWLGHIFLANPRIAVEEFFNDSILVWAMLGFESPEEITGWIGNEAYYFEIVNPNFEPERELNLFNSPFCSLVAVSSDNPLAGLVVIENVLGNSILEMTMGFELTRTQFGGHEAVIWPVKEMLDNVFMSHEERQRLEALPDCIFVALDNYLIFSGQPAVEAALELFEDEGTGTVRTATIEIELNREDITDTYSVDKADFWFELLDPPGEMVLAHNLISESLEPLPDLGENRFAFIVDEGGTITLDVLLNRVVFEYSEAGQGIIEELTELILPEPVEELTPYELYNRYRPPSEQIPIGK